MTMVCAERNGDMKENRGLRTNENVYIISGWAGINNIWFGSLVLYDKYFVFLFFSCTHLLVRALFFRVALLRFWPVARCWWVNDWVSVENRKHSTKNVTRKILFCCCCCSFGVSTIFNGKYNIFSHILFYPSESVSTMASDGHSKSVLHERTRARVLVRSSSSPSMCLCATHTVDPMDRRDTE